MKDRGLLSKPLSGALVVLVLAVAAGEVLDVVQRLLFVIEHGIVVP